MISISEKNKVKNKTKQQQQQQIQKKKIQKKIQKNNTKKTRRDEANESKAIELYISNFQLSFSTEIYVRL